MKKYLFFIFLTFITFIPTTFAVENKTGLGLLNNSTVIISNDRGSDITLSRNTANSVNMDIKTIIFQSNYSFQKNVVYEYEVEFGNQYLNDVNGISVISGSNVCSFISLKGLNSSYMQIRFSCPVDVNYITISLNNLAGNNITNSYNIRWNSIYLWSVIDTIDLGPIINNDNTNTNNIINNNNQNTQEIINNQNQNTQNMIDSQKVCNDYLINSSSIITRDYYLNDLGVSTSVTGSTPYGVTDYYSINSNSIIKLLNKESGTGGGRRACFYDSNKNNISCIQPKDFSINDIITIPETSKFVRFTINYSLDLPIWSLSTCKDGNQALDDSINGLNDSLNNDDSSGATSEASDFFSSFNTNTFGLTSIITAPLNLIQSLTSSTCSQLHLPLPYLNNKYLDLPCMTSIYQTHFGAFFTIYQTITYGIIAYWICVRIFNQVKDFKNPEHDEIEVVDL